ncbi:MazG-like family protein [Candidatus Dependentiae bacterium]
MEDRLTTVQELRDFVNAFIDARQWTQFHSPKNMSISIALEAAELMEKFQWCDNTASYKEAEKNKEKVEQELADIIITAMCFARATNIDIAQAVEKKMALNAKNYPVHKAKGVSTKYNEL